MHHTIESLTGYQIHATDGDIGKVKEFYFDDRTWTIRYVIVETGSWLFGRKILLSPEALLTPDWDNRIFRVDCTKEQIKNSPEIDTDKPVSRQQEEQLYGYYPWTSYWRAGLWAGGMGTSGMITSSTIPLEQAIHNQINAEGKENDKDLHLRSTHKVTGYNIKGTDGEIGNVNDFILNDGTWSIDFIEVDTGNWFPGKKVLISPRWIREINWATSSVVVNATEDQVKNSPEYVPSQALSDSYVANLQNYYGRIITYK